MVRAGTQNELIETAESRKAIAIGWGELGDVSALRSPDEVKVRYAHAFPNDDGKRAAINASQVHRFAHQIAEGDYVLTYDKSTRQVLIGQCSGRYEFRRDVFSESYPHTRPVKWLGRVSRDRFSEAARNSMGSTLTVFGLQSYVSEIERVLASPEPAPTATVNVPDAGEPVPSFFDDVKSKADARIADLIDRLDPYDFQDLVAALLRAMGFKAVSTSPGRDRGIDIVAHPDALGFQTPRIRGQVKHREGKVSGPDMRAFLGALRTGDSGLYVSTGGFTKDAQAEAERSREHVTMLDREEFAALMLEHYEKLDNEFKAKIPLRAVWVPAE